MVCDDGKIYEGRGFKFQGEMTVKDEFSSFDSIGATNACIGTFVDRQPSDEQRDVFYNFLMHSVYRDVLASDFMMLLQDQLSKEETFPVRLLADK